MNPNKELTITVQQFNRLTRQNQAMRGILERLSTMCPSNEGLGGHAPMPAFFELARQARAALKED